jgi:hypothetical protein
MQLPKFVLADNSDFPEDIFVIHLDFPRFIINLKDDEVEFLEDLDGKNDENNKVEFNKNNSEIANQLSKWMDFWSAGNHDDRTLAIVF